MRELVKIICATLNIKIEDEIAVLRITEKLSKWTPNLRMKFLNYAENNFNHYDLQYLSGYHKFLELSKRFERGIVELEVKRAMNEVEKRAERLVRLIRDCKDIVEAESLKGRKVEFRHIYIEGKRAFSDDDIRLLEATIGDLSSCLYFVEKWGYYELIERIVKKLEQKILVQAKRQLLPSSTEKTNAKVLEMIKNKRREYEAV